MNLWVIWSPMGILTLDAAAAQAQAADVCLGGRLAAQLVACQVAEDQHGAGGRAGGTPQVKPATKYNI